MDVPTSRGLLLVWYLPHSVQLNFTKVNLMWKKNIFLQTENSLVQLLPLFYIAKIPTSSHHCSIHAGLLCFFFVFCGVIKGQLAAVASCFQLELKGSLVGFYWETFHLRYYWNFRSPAAVQVWVLLIFLILKVLPVWSCVLCNMNDPESFSKFRIFRGIWKVKHGCLHILLAQLLLGFPAVICRQGEVLWAYRPNSGCSGRPWCFFWQKLWTFSSINPLIMWVATFLKLWWIATSSKLLMCEKLRVLCLWVINVNCVCKLYLCYIT